MPRGRMRAATTVLARRQTEVRDELPRMGESREVTNFGDDSRGDNGTDTLESLQR